MINFRHLLKSFSYAWAGIVYAFHRDQNLRVHVLIAFLVIIASIYFKVNAFEMGILGVMILLVMVAEMLNTAIEKMVDLITTEHRENAKIAKDVASGMVLLTAVGSIVVGILVFYPHISRLFMHR